MTELLNEGAFIPNLSKLKGRWLIPVAALGAALDNLASDAQPSSGDGWNALADDVFAEWA